MNGKFIVFEGVEGAGKSRQCAMLTDSLNAMGVPAMHTREPGGSELAEKLRELILSPQYSPDGLSEVYMYSAARREHIQKVVLPALEKGITVVCDRFIYSTLAYQGYGRGLDKDFIREVNRQTIQPLKVDLALFLDVPPVDGFARKGGADAGDRLERENMEFFERVYFGFQQMVGGGELKSIDASGDKFATAQKVMQAVKEIL